MRDITAVGLVASAVFGALVLSAQQPPSRLTGSAQLPASPLSLWYRVPASDHPMDPPSTSGRGANQEWVRALPVGNGRLGAMVFGGVVHERLQLNEDTLWAGRPYDPVNPEARSPGRHAVQRWSSPATICGRHRDDVPYRTLLFFITPGVSASVIAQRRVRKSGQQIPRAVVDRGRPL